MQNRKVNIDFYVNDDSHRNCKGSSSFITDMYGYAEQHNLCRSIFYLFLQNDNCSKNNCKIRIGIQYLPFGELFVNQQNTSFDTRYKFTAKEHDQESNYTYTSTGSVRRFGARYYDSDLSVWLSVDPLASKYPSLSPYVYCADNPVRFIDPDGRSFGDYWKLGANGNPVFSHTDNIQDGKIYIDRGDGVYYLLPQSSDRQYIKGRVDAHTSGGPTFNEIGGQIIKITEYDKKNMADPSKDIVFTKNLDYVDGADFLPNSTEAYITNNIVSNYTSPVGKGNSQELLYTWHDHPTGGYFESPTGTYVYTNPDGSVRNMARGTADDAMKGSFYVVGNGGPTPGYDKGRGNALGITIEPRFNQVHLINSSEYKVTVPLNWFFNVKEGDR